MHLGHSSKEDSSNGKPATYTKNYDRRELILLSEYHPMRIGDSAHVGMVVGYTDGPGRTDRLSPVAAPHVRRLFIAFNLLSGASLDLTIRKCYMAAWRGNTVAAVGICRVGFWAVRSIVEVLAPHALLAGTMGTGVFRITRK